MDCLAKIPMYIRGAIFGIGALFLYWGIINISGIWDLIQKPEYGDTPELPVSFYKSLFIFHVVAIGPLMEEFLYRWPLVWLSKRKFTRKAAVLIFAVIISSIIFGVMHTPHFGSESMPPSGWVWFGMVMSGPGFIFAIIALCCKSVVPSSVAHMAHNAILVAF